MRMRIISGELKGRLINVPKSDHIRPTTDRVRETLFNLLNNIIDFDGINILDVYAGSGSLGFECLSRGAAKVAFVEKNITIYKNLEDNIKSLNAGNQCEIHKIEAVKFSTIPPKQQFELILADPPFFKDDIYTVVKNLLLNKFLTSDGIFVIERSKQTKEKDIENLGIEPFKLIGDTCLYKILPITNE
ncbi:MAG: 16S rRNA (guanine(966)-N(2))-methyltransferase RsmD [Ignavibacteriaceae bacterium]|jgi:16S rRNA (guanine966-N2)-methyltransferase